MYRDNKPQDRVPLMQFEFDRGFNKPYQALLPLAQQGREDDVIGYATEFRDYVDDTQANIRFYGEQLNNIRALNSIEDYDHYVALQESAEFELEDVWIYRGQELGMAIDELCRHPGYEPSDKLVGVIQNIYQMRDPERVNSGGWMKPETFSRFGIEVDYFADVKQAVTEESLELDADIEYGS